MKRFLKTIMYGLIPFLAGCSVFPSEDTTDYSYLATPEYFISCVNKGYEGHKRTCWVVMDEYGEDDSVCYVEAYADYDYAVFDKVSSTVFTKMEDQPETHPNFDKANCLFGYRFERFYTALFFMTDYSSVWVWGCQGREADQNIHICYTIPSEDAHALYALALKDQEDNKPFTDYVPVDSE